MTKHFFILYTFIQITSLHSFAQETACGKVYDASTRKPVSYAIVSTSAISVYCDSLGSFEIKNLLNTSVVISCVGYETKTFTIRPGVCDTLLLSPVFQQLEPVTVGKYAWLKNPSVQIGKLNGRSKFSVNVPSGLTFLKYFPHPDTSKPYVIGSISVRVNQSENNYEPRKVRVRIFDAKSDVEIGTDLLNAADIFLIDKVVDNIATIHLNKFFVEMPKQGCFVGLEFVRSGFEGDDKYYPGFLSIKGWLSKSFEDGSVFTQYFSNKFREYTFGASQKINLYCSLNVYESR